MPEELLSGGLEISTSAIIASLIFGIIGMWMFREGRRNENFYVVLIAIALMVYPYFTKGPMADWGVGLALCGVAHRIWDH